jgi:hypothetical protein
MDGWIGWLIAHPLLALAAMVGAALVAGAAAVSPSMGEIMHRHHPPC